jgi:hypothetical protein
MEMMRRHGWWVLIVVVLAIGLLWPRLGSRDQAIIVPCQDIVAGCALSPAGLYVRFDRQPDALQRFKIFVTLPDVQEVHASFNMRGMEMGFNRYRLLPAGAGRWQAEVMLPACIQGRKDWLMVLETGGVRYEVPFTSR